MVWDSNFGVVFLFQSRNQSHGWDQREHDRPPGGLELTQQSKNETLSLPTGSDPSAGSPTETLLRLLLPLNDTVWTSSRSPAGHECPTSAQSEVLTKSFNR